MRATVGRKLLHVRCCNAIPRMPDLVYCIRPITNSDNYTLSESLGIPLKLLPICFDSNSHLRFVPAYVSNRQRELYAFRERHRTPPPLPRDSLPVRVLSGNASLYLPSGSLHPLEFLVT